MISTTHRLFARPTCHVALLAGVVALSGCLGPTYGTGTSQGEMLFDDLNNVVSFGSGGDSEPIAYTERPELRTPENTSILPPPQEPAARPETEFERRQRIQSAAYSGDGAVPVSQMTGPKPGVTQDYLDRTRGDGYDFAEVRSRDESITLSPAELRSRSALVRERIAQNSAANQNQRRYLSEPPLEYRRPSAAAPVGDPGLDEEVKQRRLRGSESLFSKVGDLLPF
ncbi:hypothetical protein [Fulvimarina sp. 2208YS6-2-32]|nr:hypothetical protein [Fulvimarina sp. 2208YS6-2-32]